MQVLAYITPITYGLLIVAAILFAWGARFLVLAQGERRRAEYLVEMRARAIDPWEMQLEMMARSDQRRPEFPTMHNGVLLYAALNAEELGETAEAIGASLRDASPSDRMWRYAARWTSLGQYLQAWAKDTRERLGRIDIGEHELSPEHAKAIFDGTSDLMVTNAGLAISAGLPGGAGYAEAQDSNLSKTNPATGVIDKTADGKWIKGPNYYEPNLLGVLAQHSPHWATRNGLRKDGSYFATFLPQGQAPQA